MCYCRAGAWQRAAHPSSSARETRGALSYTAKVTDRGVKYMDVSCFVGFITLKNTSSHGSESGRALEGAYHAYHVCCTV